MRLGFKPKAEIAEPAALQKISEAIEQYSKNQKEQALNSTVEGSRFLKSLKNAAELTQNFDTVDMDDINSAISIALLMAMLYKEQLEKDLDLIEQMKLGIQLANSRDWYRKFLGGKNGSTNAG